MNKFKAFCYLIIILTTIIGLLCTLGYFGRKYSAYSEKHKYDKTFKIEYTIQSIRVDDDAQYHITSIKTGGGEVKSWHDLDEGFEIRINYTSTTYPYVNVIYKDNGDGYGYPMGGEPIQVYLPMNYKIETFDD